MNRCILFSAFAAVSILAGGQARAGVISYVAFSNDANSGISSANTYTHALDAGSTGSAPTINGVKFTKDNSVTAFNAPGAGDAATSNAGSYVANTTGTMTSHAGSGSYPPVGLEGGAASAGVYTLLYDMWYLASSSSPYRGAATLTLTGLTPGATYDLRVYCRVWDPSLTRKNLLTFTNGSEVDTTTIYEDDPSQDGLGGDVAFYVNYRYTASASGQVTMRADNTLAAIPAGDTNGTFHLYALTNQVVPVPEPAMMSLLILGGLGLAGAARRRRR
ncbi:MAG: hypothetical protein BIFFINMI_02545 [Phycisphaerae bacterium]|nr:hypothetical protein [Phycisphaerae bacterium]